MEHKRASKAADLPSSGHVRKYNKKRSNEALLLSPDDCVFDERRASPRPSAAALLEQEKVLQGDRASLTGMPSERNFS